VYREARSRRSPALLQCILAKLRRPGAKAKKASGVAAESEELVTNFLFRQDVRALLFPRY
jgi:hypothetical protein